MPRPLYSVRFAAQHAGASGTITVPAGFRAVLRDVSAFNADAVDTNDLQLVDGESGCTIYQRTLGLQEWINDELRIVINEGQTVSVLPGFEVDVVVSGYLLAVP